MARVATLASAVAVGNPAHSTAINSTLTTAPSTSASGRCFQKPARIASTLMSSIMTTNRNSTITAPRYTSTSAIPKNSAFSSSHRAAACENASIRYSTACTGLRAVMTRRPANSSTAEKT